MACTYVQWHQVRDIPLWVVWLLTTIDYQTHICKEDQTDVATKTDQTHKVSTSESSLYIHVPATARYGDDILNYLNV